MWNENKIAKLLGIRFPIVQAPMANITTPSLVAAISNSGGLGSFAAGYLDPEEIRIAIRDIRSLTEQPFAVNLFAPSLEETDKKKITQMHKFLNKYRKELGLPVASLPSRSLPSFKEQFEVVKEEKIPVFSFTFGIPPLPYIQQLKKQQTLVIGTATSLEEALLLEKSGVDAMVAQGIEAGGHRGHFLNTHEDSSLTTLTLVPLLVQHIRVPILAAGGIMTGEGIVAALSVGAQGVQLGTAFIACAESGASPIYKRALLHANHTRTQLTSCFTGKQGRALVNRLTQEIKQNAIAPFPHQHFLTEDIRLAASNNQCPDLMALWAGQGYSFASNLPAHDILSLLVEQSAEAIHRLVEQIEGKK